MALTPQELKILVNSFLSFEYVSRDNDILMHSMKRVNVNISSVWISNRLKRLVSIKPELYPIYIKATGDKESFKSFMAELEKERMNKETE